MKRIIASGTGKGATGRSIGSAIGGIITGRTTAIGTGAGGTITPTGRCRSPACCAICAGITITALTASGCATVGIGSTPTTATAGRCG